MHTKKHQTHFGLSAKPQKCLRNPQKVSGRCRPKKGQTRWTLINLQKIWCGICTRKQHRRNPGLKDYHSHALRTKEHNKKKKCSKSTSETLPRKKNKIIKKKSTWKMHAKTHQTPHQVHTRKKHKHRPDALKRTIQYNNLQMPQKCFSNPKSTSETKKLTQNQTKSAWQMHAKRCQTLAGHPKKS